LSLLSLRVWRKLPVSSPNCSNYQRFWQQFCHHRVEIVFVVSQNLAIDNQILVNDNQILVSDNQVLINDIQILVDDIQILVSDNQVLVNDIQIRRVIRR
jgi:hypothetical protein